MAADFPDGLAELQKQKWTDRRFFALDQVRCETCQAEQLVAFSCKHRGFCPSCGGRRMAETAALLVDEVLPRKPIRQWVLSLPFALR